jgi:pilus assembly protein Flp/PilA
VGGVRVYHLGMVGTSRALGAHYFRAAEAIRSALTADEDGQGMVEYALILVLIALVVIVVLQVLGKQVNNVFSNVSNGLSH